ncbi:Pol polyprotein [Leucoagaricus sp. SymC.cos]|nr:Pol polyprotein [Leucoagaricus sp. SymC.cos]
MQLTVLSQGWTGLVGIFHNDVAFILQHEMDKAPNFLDDITLLGPKTHHKKPDSTYKTIPKNPNIQHFVWEHTVDLNWVLYCLVHMKAMVLAKKLQLCQLEIIVVGRKCTYKEQEPDTGMVEKVLKWPECRNVLEVQGFLRMAGTVRNWIKGFAEVANPLTKLTRVIKEEFRWGEEQKLAMEEMKPIDHVLLFPIILSVDTLVITVSFILAQLSQYSQSKLKLYSLFQVLNAIKLWIISAKKLVIEVDAQYIKGILNKPDIHPNTAINKSNSELSFPEALNKVGQFDLLTHVLLSIAAYLYVLQRYFPNPQKIQGFRFADKDPLKWQLTSLNPEFMTYGIGKHACPGRFFAVTEIKAVVARLLIEYDIRLTNNEKVRPTDLWYTDISVAPNKKATISSRKRLRPQ